VELKKMERDIKFEEARCGVHACGPSIQEAKAEGLRFQDSLTTKQV
jgi:hypothetical protein